MQRDSSERPPIDAIVSLDGEWLLCGRCGERLALVSDGCPGMWARLGDDGVYRAFADERGMALKRPRSREPIRHWPRRGVEVIFTIFATRPDGPVLVACPRPARCGRTNRLPPPPERAREDWDFD